MLGVRARACQANFPCEPVTNEIFDFVIVGAGSAGCVLANRLSSGGAHRVLLLEAGPWDRNLWVHVPIGYAKTMFHPTLNWGFYTEPESGMAGRKIYWPRGRVVGGSSSINGLIYVRGQPEDYDDWGKLGNEGWSWSGVEPYFRKLENYHGESNQIRGHHGPLHIQPIAPSTLCDAFIEAAVQTGIPANPDYNGSRQEGAGYFQITTNHGLRCSAAGAYLRPVKERDNLEVRTNARTLRVLLSEGRASGVTYEREGRVVQATARKEVIVAAGAINSPQLLQLSGIGSAKLLQQHGIPVAVDLPGVGANLQDHLQIRLTYKASRPVTTNDYLRSPLGKMRMGLQFLLRQAGPIAVGINQAYIFTRSDGTATRPDIQFHFGTISSEVPGGPVHPFSGFTSSVCQLRPVSRGSIEIASADPKAPPKMRPNYLDDPYDQHIMVEGVKVARKVAAAPALASFIEHEIAPGPAVESDAELLDYIRKSGTTIFHPSGTCKMGVDDMAVLDTRLRVRGVKNLRVVDASVMPSLVSGNTNGPVIMIAEKASDMILEDAQ
jgi:choline dehydrogenase-like flavoprotein